MSETSLPRQARIEKILRQRNARRRIFLEETFKPKRKLWQFWRREPKRESGAVKDRINSPEIR